MPYSNNNSAPFDFSTLDSAKPATYNQIKFRIGNVATAVLFSRLDLNRDNFKSANRKIFTQMASALQTATIDSPLTNADIQAIDSTGDVTKYRAMFERAFTELYCTSDELHKLLIKDGLSAKKADVATNKYTMLHGDIPLVETVEAKAPKAKAPKITARAKVKSDKPLKVSALTDGQRADAIAMLQQRLDELLES